MRPRSSRLTYARSQDLPPGRRSDAGPGARPEPPRSPGSAGARGRSWTSPCGYGAPLNTKPGTTDSFAWAGTFDREHGIHRWARSRVRRDSGPISYRCYQPISVSATLLRIWCHISTGRDAARGRDESARRGMAPRRRLIDTGSDRIRRSRVSLLVVTDDRDLLGRGRGRVESQVEPGSDQLLGDLRPDHPRP